ATNLTICQKWTLLPKFYTLSLRDALPISSLDITASSGESGSTSARSSARTWPLSITTQASAGSVMPVRKFATSSMGFCVADRNRSEEHTSELQSRRELVCRLLLEKKKSRT